VGHEDTKDRALTGHEDTKRNGTAPIGVIAHYNLLEQLEPSGPGDLFRARDTKKGRTVTIRLLPESLAPDSRTRAALIRQTIGVRSLSHPNVITHFDAGEHEGRVYLVFEFLTGQALRGEMAGRPMNVQRAVEVAIQVADAVADAHAAEFAHGGLSPESVVVTAKGRVKIPAFALASRAGFDGDGGELRDYESPEEARGQAPDDRSDIYSVGAILYEMLTTRRPNMKGASAPSVSNRHVTPELDDLVLRAIAPNPDSRYQTTATFAAELRAMAARLEARGDAEQEETPDAPEAASGSRLLLAVVLLAAAAAIAWLVLR
jgi:serine/threonine protein kinase